MMTMTGRFVVKATIKTARDKVNGAGPNGRQATVLKQAENEGYGGRNGAINGAREGRKNGIKRKRSR
jgi:hypothetical protein